MKGTDIVFLCFSLDSAESFEAMDAEYHRFQESCEAAGPRFPYLIVGTKSDQKRVISFEVVQEWVTDKQGRFTYMEVSTKHGTGVQDLFSQAIDIVTGGIRPKHYNYPRSSYYDDDSEDDFGFISAVDEIADDIIDSATAVASELTQIFSQIDEESMKETLENLNAWGKSTGEQLTEQINGIGGIFGSLFVPAQGVPQGEGEQSTVEQTEGQAPSQSVGEQVTEQLSGIGGMIGSFFVPAQGVAQEQPKENVPEQVTEQTAGIGGLFGSIFSSTPTQPQPEEEEEKPKESGIFGSFFSPSNPRKPQAQLTGLFNSFFAPAPVSLPVGPTDLESDFMDLGPHEFEMPAELRVPSEFGGQEFSGQAEYEEQEFEIHEFSGEYEEFEAPGYGLQEEVGEFDEKEEFAFDI
eukprot:TRINITY_DN5978_c0_g1_i1.p1 TRINITY_DN5978_c0_g1~~TRINITY_DN5978_c0_g1_i1.p1  ORF type:complete len:407 (-),score=96.69 TRINITY_DN5978_c0_g1_i1:66-1286(-)